jgi:hypothetical protein
MKIEVNWKGILLMNALKSRPRKSNCERSEMNLSGDGFSKTFSPRAIRVGSLMIGCHGSHA